MQKVRNKATISKRKFKSKTSYKCQVRRKGFRTIVKSFDTLSFEQRIIKDLVHAQIYIHQDNLEDDFKSFRDKYCKEKYDYYTNYFKKKNLFNNKIYLWE